jgi:HIRAN domain
MRSLLNLLLNQRTPDATREGVVEATLYGGHETLEVVGESHYQESLWRIVGGHTAEPVHYETHAVLVPDPENEYDANAIEVRINGALVGYLSRDDAAAYRPGLMQLMEKDGQRLVALRGVIVGGGPRGAGIGNLGVFLDHDPVDFGLARHHTGHGHLRTGLSEAIEANREGDGYDLSWYAHLAADDETAIQQIRSKLNIERQSVSRHFLFSKLEHRLYRCRSRSSALDEFDAVCAEHHAEMVEIRPALLREFGAVPVVEMYRQAAIRCQKARLWREAGEWAERGIAVYGDSAARPEAVEDLRKRLALAAAKLNMATEPPRARRQTRGKPKTQLELEVLFCGVCGRSFERLRTRGRKPTTCPACRDQGHSQPSTRP